MASHPYTRVAHLLDMSDPNNWRPGPTNTPSTLTGGRHALYSYRLCILEPCTFDNDPSKAGYRLHPDNNSPTTNRHIRAVARVLEHNNYRPSFTDERGYTVYTIQRDDDGL
jgi:hypothetical protein